MNIEEQPLVSILTPVYNGGNFLTECIESVLSQTYQNFEYIIVNNCSQDRTLEIAQQYAAKDRRIRIHNNETFVGVIDNHNLAFGLISAQARYCKVVSADDRIFPDCISHMVELAEANPSVGIVGCYQLSGGVVRWQGFRYPAFVMSGREVGRQFLLQEQVTVQGLPIFGFGTPTSLLYRADLVRSTKAFYPDASPHSDTSACFEQLQKSDFGFVYEVLSFEKTHSETQSSASAEMNRYSSACLNDLLRYGSWYLNKHELDARLKNTLDGYYRFLGVNYFVGFRNKNFWEYHRGRLKDLGYPLPVLALLKGFLIAVLQEIANPGLAIEKLLKRLFPKRDGVAVATAPAIASPSALRTERNRQAAIGPGVTVPSNRG